MTPWQLMNLQSPSGKLGPDEPRINPRLVRGQQNNTPVIRIWTVSSNGLCASSEEIEHTKIGGEFEVQTLDRSDTPAA